MITGSGAADGVDVAASGGQVGAVDQPAGAEKSETLQKVVGRTAAGLGATATILGAVLYVFRARLF